MSDNAPAPADAGTAAYDAAKQLFDTFAPDEVKAQYRFPSRAEAEAALQKFQAALDHGSLEDLAPYATQARDLLPALDAIPGCGDYAVWLRSRIDELEAASAMRRLPGHSAPDRAPVPRAGESRPPAGIAPRFPVAGPAVPFLPEWTSRVRGRPMPAGAAELMPRLQEAFRAEGVPPQIAWLAEAESSLDPGARSPAGARGLFQLKADTARELGLSTFLPDDRTNPEKSAHAAARDLRSLVRRFHSWPLAFAAYNAGAGRVGRALEARHATTYAEIASGLPGETRMYVPKVCALISLRTGVPPQRLPL